MKIIKELKKKSNSELFERASVKRRGTAFLLSFLLLMSVANLPAYAANDFTLEDQFGNKTSVAFPSDKPVILVFGDREGSEQVEGWVRPLYNRFTDRVYIFGIAELSAVPWAVRPVVRRVIKSKSKNPVMLDWTGEVSKAYGYQKGKANVFVLNKSGKIIASDTGAADNSSIENLANKINSAL